MIEIGQTVGNYNVTAKLGEGGMGVVYLAEHPVIGRKAALKAIHPHFGHSADVVSRFITEAKSINQIGNEHIVDVTDFGTTPAGDFYFIMEYLQGEALVDRLDRITRLPPERALSIAGQITKALQASHDHGVVHRDLKPDNVFLVTQGDDDHFVKVLDFGLAKLVGVDGAALRTTQSGAVVGTPYYMAPEQCEGKIDVDHRVDVYALGVMLFEMLTGKIPFGGTGFGEVILKHMTMPPPSARRLVPELSPALDEILLRALAKDPADRFQSMAEFGAALADPEAYAAGLPQVVQNDISGRFRAAAPMSRSEMMTRATLLTLVEAASAASAPAPSSSPAIPRRSNPGRSTLREGVGELTPAELDTLPRARYGRKLAVVAVAMTALGVFATSAYKRPVARVVEAARVLARPATVRLNFNSDPVGATIVRADGIVLGVTPLSVEAPYSDAPAQFLFHKEGFVTKTVALVPNLPSPIFETLESVPSPKLEVPALPDLADTALAQEVHAALRIAATEPRSPRKVHSSHHHESAAVAADPDADTGDEDETLEPTAQ
jgi:serine/threonine protein kinase